MWNLAQLTTKAVDELLVPLVMHSFPTTLNK
jgi:hypothetical protein